MHKFALLLLLAATAASAQEVTIKDFVLGGDLRAEGARAGLRCAPSPVSGSLLELCGAAGPGELPAAVKTIAGVETRRAFLYGFENVLGAVEFTFDAARFALVRDALKEKYPALHCVDSVVRNRAGAEFDQTVCRYRDEKAELTLERRSTDLTAGRLLAGTFAFRAATSAEHKRRAGEGKKDL